MASPVVARAMTPLSCRPENGVASVPIRSARDHVVAKRLVRSLAQQYDAQSLNQNPNIQPQ